MRKYSLSLSNFIGYDTITEIKELVKAQIEKDVLKKGGRPANQCSEIIGPKYIKNT
jgi:hypothetical protein